MGKRIISQRRGKGTSTYKSPNSGKKYKPKYGKSKGKIIDILHDKGRNSPIAKVQYEEGVGYVIAPLGLKVGDTTENIGVPLSQVTESSQIFAIETYPNSGPKLCMSPGTAAILVSKNDKECVVKMPSKKQKSFHPNCRVTIGSPAGDGRSDKPWVKAGKKYFAMKARGKLYPRTSGNSMNAYDHPYGAGYSGGLGNSKTVSRHAPPGAKVGSIAPKRTGKRK